nr:MAG TPA: hypothetical protein [Caudoviricetes sp.]
MFNRLLLCIKQPTRYICISTTPPILGCFIRL